MTAPSGMPGCEIAVGELAGQPIEIDRLAAVMRFAVGVEEFRSIGAELRGAHPLRRFEDHLQPVAVGIVEVVGVVHEMVGRVLVMVDRFGAEVDAGEILHGRHVNGQVVQPAVIARQGRRGSWMQHDQRAVRNAEHGDRIGAGQELQADQIAPEAQRALDIGDVEVNRAKGREVAVDAGNGGSRALGFHGISFLRWAARSRETVRLA